MEKIAFFDTKPYDKEWFDKINKNYEIRYFEGCLTRKLQMYFLRYIGSSTMTRDSANRIDK